MKRAGLIAAMATFAFAQENPQSIHEVKYKNGVDCSEHGRHFYGTCVAYTYLKHRGSCPFGKNSLIEDIERLTPTK